MSTIGLNKQGYPIETYADSSNQSKTEKSLTSTLKNMTELRS